MNKQRIAITGGIGSGKSTVLKILKEEGYPVFSCDEISKELFSEQTYVEKIEKVFPTAVLDGKIDRKALSGIIFNDKKKRAQLNSIAHPLIMQRLLLRMNECQDRLTFAEVPLLFEIDAEDSFDTVWVVMRDMESRITAVEKRDGVSTAEVQRRISAQIDYTTKKGKEKLTGQNVYIIDNNVPLKNLTENIKELLKNVAQS